MKSAGGNMRQTGRLFVVIAALIAVVSIAAGCSVREDNEALPPLYAIPDIPEPRSGRPAVFVTDFGLGLSAGWREGPSDVDDAMAVALAATSDEFDIVGLVTTFGNTILPPQGDVAVPGFLDVLEYGKIAVADGSPRAISDPQLTFGDADLNSGCMNDGVELLAEVLRQRDDVIVFAIGPLTPVACLVLNEPELASGIGDLVVLMGVEPTTPLEVNGHTVSDFNFGMDVRAAQIVFEQSDIPITLITFETSSASLVTVDQLNQIGEQDNELSRYFTELSESWVEFWTSAIGEDGTHPWDANTVWWAVSPETYNCAMTGYEIDTSSASKPGTSIEDTMSHLYVGDQYQSRQVRACTGYASDQTEEEFIDAVVETLSGSH